MKIKQNDKVIVISGKDKGQTGKVLKVISSSDKVVVEGINICKKHIKHKGKNKKGEILELPNPIHVSNVSIIDSKTNKPSRIGYKIEDGKKKRIVKKSGQEI